MTFIKAIKTAQTCKNNNDLLQLLKQLTQLKADQIAIVKHEFKRNMMEV